MESMIKFNVTCQKHGKLKNSEVAYIFHKTIISIIWCKCNSKGKKIVKEKNNWNKILILTKNI